MTGILAPVTEVFEPPFNTAGSALTKADEAAEAIQAAIISGEFAPGEKLGEAELCSRLGAKRGPIREALSRLESRGLVVRRPNAGFNVVSIGADELLDLYRIREVLEGLAARQAAVAMNLSGRQQLFDILERHEKAIHLSQGTRYDQGEGIDDFHYLIVKGAQNPRLEQMLLGSLYHLLRMYRRRLSSSSGRPQRGLTEHRHIAEAINGGDGELAEYLIRRHLNAARRDIEAKIASGEIKL